MHKALFLVLVFFSLIGCERNVEKKEKALIIWSGESPDNLDLSLIEDFKLDSIQFTQSTYKYLLQGVVILKKEKHTFSLMFDRHPLKSGKHEVFHWNFPLEEIDSTNYNCYFQSTEGGYYVKWINSENELRIFIKENFISER